MTDHGIPALLVQSELKLMDPAVRADAAVVDALLDPDFVEIGQSGRLWSRSEMLDALGEQEVSSALNAPDLTEVRVGALAPDLYLLTYLLKAGPVWSRRSSIWRINDGPPRMVFHQGTRALDL